MCTMKPSESFPVDAEGWVISKGDFVALYEPFPENGEIDTNKVDATALFRIIGINIVTGKIMGIRVDSNKPNDYSFRELSPKKDYILVQLANKNWELFQ